MLEYAKILDYWKSLSEEDKEKYVIFTSILCKYYDGDFSWTNRDSELSIPEMEKIEKDLPHDILEFIEKTDKQKDIEQEKNFCEAIINSNIESIKSALVDKYNSCYLDSARKMMILNDIENLSRIRLSTEDGADISNCKIMIKKSDESLTLYIEKKTANYGMTYRCGYDFSFEGCELNITKFFEKWT